MPSIMIGVTFFLGVALAIVAVIALFTNRRGGKGALKIPGVEISGTGAPILFLLVSAAMVLSGFGWATTRQEKETAVREAGKLSESLETQQKISAELASQISRPALEQLKRNRTDLFKAQPYQASPWLKSEIAKMGPR